MSTKINLQDPAEVRKWNERIARFMGWETDRDYNINSVWKDPDGRFHRNGPPQYHRDPAALLEVLRKIAEDAGMWEAFEDKGGFCVFIGPGREFGARCFDTFTEAAFLAICQYLERKES